MASRRAKGDGSLRKRPEGRWKGRYTVGTDYATGKRIQKGVFGKTKTEARDKLRRAGFEPVIAAVKGLCPNQLDERTVSREETPCEFMRRN